MILMMNHHLIHISVNNSDVNDDDNHIYAYTYLSDCRYLYIYIYNYIYICHIHEPTSGDLAITNPEII